MAVVDLKATTPNLLKRTPGLVGKNIQVALRRGRGVFRSDFCVAFHVRNIPVALLPKMSDDGLHTTALIGSIRSVHFQEQVGMPFQRAACFKT